MWAKEALAVLGCSYNTLKGWARQGKIRTSEVSNGRKMYWDDDVYAMIGKKVVRENWSVVYCRVNGRDDKARALMAKQQGLIREWCAVNGYKIERLYDDWAPATDFSISRRPALWEMVQDVIKKKISVIIVETPDRLARVGWEMFQVLFRYYGVELVFMNTSIQVPEYQQEQEQDLVNLLLSVGVTRLDKLAADTRLTPRSPVSGKHPGKITPNWEDAPDAYSDPDQELSDLM